MTALRARAQPPVALPAPAPVQPAAGAQPVTRKLVLDVHSRSLHWLRSPDDVAEAAIEMVCGGVCPTVQAFPGHIDPAKVAQELPAFVKRVRSHGLRVTQIKGPAIKDVTEPNADAIIGTAAQNGITHYSLGGYTYDLAKPLAPQLDAIKLRLDKFVRLNQKHKIKLVYDTVPGPASVGGVVLDLLPIMKPFDPKYIGFHWDTGHMALHGDDMWETLMRHAGPYIAAVGWRDRGWVQDLGLKGEGGPYTGPVARVEPLVTQPDGSAIPGIPGAAPAGRGGAAGRGGRGGRGGGRAGAAPGEEGAAPAGAPAGAGARAVRRTPPARAASTTGIPSTSRSTARCRSARSAARTPRAAAGARRASRWGPAPSTSRASRRSSRRTGFNGPSEL